MLSLGSEVNDTSPYYIACYRSSSSRNASDFSSDESTSSCCANTLSTIIANIDPAAILGVCIVAQLPAVTPAKPNPIVPSTRGTATPPTTVPPTVIIVMIAVGLRTPDHRRKIVTFSRISGGPLLDLIANG